MPDWFTHTLVGWITGRLIKRDVGLLVVGSLIPDIKYIGLIFENFGGVSYNIFLEAFHTPIGSFLIAGIFALFFKDIKKVLIPLGIGIITHFILDFFLLHVSGGIKLFFPVSWSEYQYHLIRSEDYTMTIIAIIVAVLVYIGYFYYEKRDGAQTV
jgi:hypothetical protein